MNQGFAGLDMGLPQAAESLDVIQRIAAVWAGFCDISRVEANIRLLKEERERSLEAMERAAAAERSLAELTNKQERMAAELQAKAQDLEARTRTLDARDQAITQREANWQELTARLRSAA
jgi:hypothetical protein